MSHPVSDAHILAIAASRRMSKRPESAIVDVSSTSASMAKVSAAILPSFCAMASCRPTGRPHWTRLPAQSRSIAREPLPAMVQKAGRARRPVLRVMSASFRPLPSPHRRFSRGTFTSVKRRTPLDRPRRPMNEHSCATSTPSHSVSTMKAEIGRRREPSGAGVARHDDDDLGARAVRRPQLLAVQDPVRAVLGELGGGGHVRRVGADVLLGQREGGERPPREPGQVALLLLLGAELQQRPGHADALVRGQEGAGRAAPRSHDPQGPRIRELGEAEPTVLDGGLDPERAELGEAVENLLGNPALPVDGVAVDVVARERLELLQELGGPLLLLGVRARMRVHQPQVEPALEERAREAALLPVLLACLLGDLPSLELRRQLPIACHRGLLLTSRTASANVILHNRPTCQNLRTPRGPRRRGGGSPRSRPRGPARRPRRSRSARTGSRAGRAPGRGSRDSWSPWCRGRG